MANTAAFNKPYAINKDRVIDFFRENWHAETKTIAVEASTVRYNSAYQLYNDACDIGVWVKSNVTGKVSPFGYWKVDERDGEVDGWWFTCGDINLLIIND